MTGIRIALFGASGRTGRRLIAQAIPAGHEVIAVTRRPDSIRPRAGLRVIVADATNTTAVEKAVAGADAVASALGVPYSLKPISIYSAGIANVLGAMDIHGVRRLVVVSSAPLDPAYRARDSWLFTRAMEPLLMRLPGRTTYDDMARMESQVTGSGVEWTIVRSSWLFDAAAVSAYQLVTGTPTGMYTARPDLAAAMLAQLTDRRYLRRVVAVNTTEGTPRLVTQIWRENIKGR
ncbi:NAD(P)-dependent oxidoreductase [Phytoactinopolyspora mesophila]|uniref:NAD(P)-dependent oxidoreductase n=1 Tax=Phytoactinopolyspora mesophila TaxID=2650750 RepID=UPI001C9E3EC3